MNGENVELPRQKWKLKPGAVPHIFPNLPKYLSVPFKSRKKPSTSTRKRKAEDLPDTSTSYIPEIRGKQCYNDDSCSYNKGKNVTSDPEKTIASLKNEVRNLNRKLVRAKISLSSAKARINGLVRQTKSAVCHCKESAVLSNKQKIVIDTILKKCSVKNYKGMRYSNEFILESLLLKIKSPKGYRHCLHHELLPLPSEKYLQKLCKGLKCPYGLNTHAIDAIAQCYKDEADENKRYGVVIFDEVKLREELQFNNASLKVDGFVDFGELTPDSHKNQLANHALVFMFVPFMQSWVQPVAVYASRNSTPADILAKILIQVILQLEEAGAKIVGFTCDGSQTNKKAWKSLGISGKKGQCKCFILNPADNERKLWAFSDFVHVLKCVRNHFRNKGEVYYKDKIINFNFYRKVFNDDSSGSEGLKVCPKLSLAHIEPSSFQKMNARLAFQIFSNSVANGLKFYRDISSPGFEGSESTENFTRDLNEVADSLNSTIPIKALYKGSPSHTILINFLHSLNTTNNTFASDRTMESLRVSLKSTLQLCEFLWSKGFRYVLTSKLNQDPLERHFGIMRSLSCDDHPSTIDFLQLHLLQCIYVPIKQALSSGGNCESKSEVPLTSYVNQMRLLARNTEQRNKETKESVENALKRKIVLQEDGFEFQDWESAVPEFENPATVTEKCLVYHLSGYVVKHSSKFIQCNLCVSSLRHHGHKSQYSTLTDIKDFGYGRDISFLTHPSEGVFNLLMQTERTIKETLSNGMWGDIFYECIDSINSIVIQPLGTGCCLDHTMDIIPKLIYHYMKCRFFFRTKEIRRELQAPKTAKSSRKLSKVSDK